jgi:hypothetical protein
LGFGGSSGEKVLENKAFSHAGAAEVGGFTPNMGYSHPDRIPNSHLASEAA